MVVEGLEAALAAALLRPLHALGQAPPPPSSSPISRMSFPRPGWPPARGARVGEHGARAGVADGGEELERAVEPGSPPPTCRARRSGWARSRRPCQGRSARGARAARAPRRGSPAGRAPCPRSSPPPSPPAAPRAGDIGIDADRDLEGAVRERGVRDADGRGHGRTLHRRPGATRGARAGSGSSARGPVRHRR